MLVKKLEVTIYDENGYHWETHETPQPSWGQIEAAIRRLDRFRYPFIFLRLDDYIEEGEHISIIGGNGAYGIEGFLRKQQRMYRDPNRSGEDEIRVWTSDQGCSLRENEVCDLETALKAARYVCDKGDYDPDLPWD
jgi:hypothetical protein